MLVCPVGHALAARRAVRWSELADLAANPGDTRLVLMKRGSGVRVLTDKTLAGLGEKIKPTFEVAHVSTAVGLVEAGLGVAILPSYAISRTRSTGVATVALTVPAVQRDIVALTPVKRVVCAACDTFLAHFQREMSRTGTTVQRATPTRSASRRAPSRSSAKKR